MASHKVYYGRGAQDIVTVPHKSGQPVRVASATYEIVDSRHSVDSSAHVVVAAGTAATLDTLSTTTSAAAGRSGTDRRALTVVSTTGLTVGHLYILTAASGEAELVTIAAVPSGTVARTVSDIRGTYATGATLRGIEVTATFPALEADDDENLDGLPFIVIWNFPTMPPVREPIFADRGVEAQLATLADLQQLDPFVSKIGGDAVSPATALARAHRDLRTDLEIAGVLEADLLAGNIGRDCVIYRAAYLVFVHDTSDGAQRKANDYQTRYETLRAALTVGDRTKPGVTALSSDELITTKNPARGFVMFGY